VTVSPDLLRDAADTAPAPGGPSPNDPNPASPPGSGFWTLVRESLRGSEHDYSRGPLGRAVLLLAVPMVLEMAMESVFAVTDIFFVAHLGPDATAAVGLTESLLAVVYALAMGLAIGATAIVARRTGEQDPAGAARGAGQAILLAAIVAVVLGALGVALAPRLLALMGASPGVLATGVNYTRVMLGGEASIILLFVANAIFRGVGEPAVAMRTLWVANGINIVLGPLLIFGPGPLPALGVTGAAVATTIGRGTGAAIALWQLMRTRPAGAAPARVRVGARDLRPDRAGMTALVRLSASAALQSLVGTASWIGLVRIVALFGSAALAGYTVAIRLVIFALLPAWGLSNAAATLVGQSLGAKDPARAERAVWTTARYNAAFLGGIGLLFLLAAGPLVGVFTPDAEVAAIAVRCLRIVASGFVFYAFGMVLTAAFNGAGDTRTPTLLNLVVFWLFEIPLAWVLAVPLGWGPDGAFAAVAIAFSVLAVASAVLFRRGRWRTQAV
jgi:putative MATE family efflux protein